MALAWSLDRQIPQWFGEVNERAAAPLNAILTVVGIAGVFLVLENFSLLPHSIAPPDGKLNLVATAWFSIIMAALSWINPGLNAILIRFRRPDLVRNAPFRRALPWLGAVWLVFPLWIYFFAAAKPLYQDVTASSGGGLEYLNHSGITGTLLFTAIGIVIYIVVRVVHRRRGVDESMMFAELPPD
jgi:amino acid transporter